MNPRLTTFADTEANVNTNLIIKTIFEQGSNVDLKSPTWEFDILDFSANRGGNGLVHLLLLIIKQHNFMHRFNISMTEMYNFALRVQEGYKFENPYHNAVHGASVMYDMHWFMLQDG